MRTYLASATHIYYLASPVIAKGTPDRFDDKLFQVFKNFYLDGMTNLVSAAIAQRPNGLPLSLFLPSSVFLEENVRGFAEYIAAKKEAESYAKNLADSHGFLSITAPRLPRMLTDQTSSMRGIEENDNQSVIVSILLDSYGKADNST